MAKRFVCCCVLTAASVAVFSAVAPCCLAGLAAPDKAAAAGHEFFIDCAGARGDGSSTHPWNALSVAQAHPFSPGDRISLRRGTECRGSFTPRGSGTKDAPIRLTAYGEGARPRIVASKSDRQILLLANQEYWQVDSLDLSGASTYGVFVTGDKGVLHHIYLRNLSVHDVHGGEMKNKDNGLVVIGPSKLGTWFEDVLVDGVDAAHTEQWAGILVGGGPFYIPPDQYINKNVVIRNSTAHDVYGDGIVLFRDAQSTIETSVAWETGMQPTQTIGTPNAIWTWTCTDCTVQDNEAFLTDSPGVDGGAYDIDWSNTRNIVQRNFAHDTQGYCFAVFAAGYVTSESTVRDNLCVNNALSPRLAAMQGAAYLSTWNGGVIRDLRIENNTFVWDPPVASAAAVVEAAETAGTAIVFTGNQVESRAPMIYRAGSHFRPSSNTYSYQGSDQVRFTLPGLKQTSFEALQKAGFENGSKLTEPGNKAPAVGSLKIDATLDFELDSDGLLDNSPRAQLVVLRSLAFQYPPEALSIVVHFRQSPGTLTQRIAEANASLDLNVPMIRFVEDGQGGNTIRLTAPDGHELQVWTGFQNAATLGGAVRKMLGTPNYARMRIDSPAEEIR